MLIPRIGHSPHKYLVVPHYFELNIIEYLLQQKLKTKIMREAAMSVLLPHFNRWENKSLKRKTFSMFRPPTIVFCRTAPEDIRTFFESKFRNNNFQVQEALKQIVSVSPRRIQWESKEGANLMEMTLAALSQMGSSFTCKVNSNSLRFSNESVSLDVALGRTTCTFTIFSDDEEMPSLQKAAVESVSSDIKNNVRSFSYSYSSSGEGVVGMEGLLDSFFSSSFNGANIPQHAPSSRVAEDPCQALEAMGVEVIIPSKSTSSGRKVDWSTLAGYESVKAQVEESVILGLKHPSNLDKIIAKTRSALENNEKKIISNKPKVVLFEGPPGTGKSSSAKIIASETNVPMIHIPLESVVSKWFGESEKQIARIYQLARELADQQSASSVILFIDEIDSLVSSRDLGTPHEASKRILSVMLRQIDGFNSDREKNRKVQTTLICATNRKKDLDQAFLSRVDASIHFGLPSEDSRTKILKLYAKHLGPSDIKTLASITEGLSGRNLKDLCQTAERQWAAALMSGHSSDKDVDVTPPPIDVYIGAAKRKYAEQLQ